MSTLMEQSGGENASGTAAQRPKKVFFKFLFQPLVGFGTHSPMKYSKMYDGYDCSNIVLFLVPVPPPYIYGYMNLPLPAVCKPVHQG